MAARVNWLSSSRASRRPMGSFMLQNEGAFPSYEAKVSSSILATWRRYSTAQAGSAVSQSKAKIPPTSVRDFMSVLLLCLKAPGLVADGSCHGPRATAPWSRARRLAGHPSRRSGEPGSPDGVQVLRRLYASSDAGPTNRAVEAHSTQL